MNHLGGKPSSAEPDKSMQPNGVTSACSWDAKTGNARFDLAFNRKFHNGLADVLAGQQQQHGFEDFEEIEPVSGYPAVIANLRKDERSNGTCSIAVGVNNRTVMFARVFFSSADDPCHGARTVAEAAIQTLKEGS